MQRESGRAWASFSQAGMGSIARGDIAGNPFLGIGGLVARPTVIYTDLIGYSQECVKDDVSRTVTAAIPRKRTVKVESQANNNPATFQTITGCLLTGYWTVLLSDVPTDLRSLIEPGLVPAGPVTEARTSGGKLTFNCNSKSGDVVIWNAPNPAPALPSKKSSVAPAA